MKQKNFILIVLVTFLFIQNVEANIWRVNNNATALYGSNFGGTATKPVFQQLFGSGPTSATGSLNLVQDGDTIYLEGSPFPYDGGNLTKQITIIGPGYFLSENPNSSNDLLEAALYFMTFSPGSEGSQLIGVHSYYIGGTNIYIKASNILIKRCLLERNIYVDKNISDITIIQNFFRNAGNANLSAITTTNDQGFPANFVFNNNICQRTLIAAYSQTSITYTIQECKNNVFDCPAISGEFSIKMNAASFQNNILKTPGALVDVNGGNISYNISASANQFGTANNNIVITDMSNLFIDQATNSTEGDYQLVQPQTTNQLGSDGTDRGAFGGAATINHYTLSGLAPIPVIYQITTPGAASTNLPVTVSARTIK